MNTVSRSILTTGEAAFAASRAGSTIILAIIIAELFPG